MAQKQKAVPKKFSGEYLTCSQISFFDLTRYQGQRPPRIKKPTSSQPVRRSLRLEQQKKRTLGSIGTGKDNQLQLFSRKIYALCKEVGSDEWCISWLSKS